MYSMLDFFPSTVTSLLVFILLLPLIGVFFLLLVPASNCSLLKNIALNTACITYVLSLFLWVFFNKSISSFQFVSKLLWIPFLNLNFTLGVDGISLFFILLTTLLIFLCILISWTSVKKNVKEFLIAFLVMEFFLIGVFSILDLLLFYIFFESVLIPMYLIVGVWGSRERKIKAAYFFFLYTWLGSVFFIALFAFYEVSLFNCWVYLVAGICMTLRLLYFIYVLWVLTKAAKLYYWVFIVCPLVEQQNKSNLLVILHQTNLTNKVRLYTQSTIIKKNKKHKLKKNNKKRKPKKDTFKKINKTVTGNQNTDPKNPKIIWLVLLTILIFLFHDELNSCPSLYTELSSIKGSTVYCESPNPQRLEESSEPVSDANAELLAGEPLGQVINFPPNVNLAGEPLEQPALEEVRVRFQVAPEDQAALEKLKEYLKKTLPRQAASDDSISIVTAVSNGEEGRLADYEQGECPNLYFPEVVSLEHDAAPEWFPEFVSEINDVPRQPANPAPLGANDNSCFVSVASADINPAPANGPGSVNAAESPRGQAVPEHQAASDADDSISNTSNASLDAPTPKRAKKR